MFDAGGGGRTRTELLLCKFAELHAEQRKRRVCARIRWKIDPGNLRIKKICLRWFLCALQKFVPVDDLHNATRPGAIAEIHAIALGTRGYGSMQLREH